LNIDPLSVVLGVELAQQLRAALTTEDVAKLRPEDQPQRACPGVKGQQHSPPLGSYPDLEGK